jgi:hypothetical protein
VQRIFEKLLQRGIEQCFLLIHRGVQKKIILF